MNGIIHTAKITGRLSGIGTMSGKITIPEVAGVTPYTGEYTVTPTHEVQTLATAKKGMARDVVINPIPGNYGLITWNGSVLTVS